jgi:LacI family transcriptional regulator
MITDPMTQSPSVARHGLISKFGLDAREHALRARRKLPSAGLAGRPRRIALAFSILPATLHAVMRGVSEFAAKQGKWILTTHGEATQVPLDGLHGWNGDGIIALLDTPSEARAARRFFMRGTPVVTFSGTLHDPGVPRVTTDDAAIGRAAAEHLISQRYERFALFTLGGSAYSAARGAAFAARLRASGKTFATYESPAGSSLSPAWHDETQALMDWVRALPRPTGVFAVNDYLAQRVTEACGDCDIRVPNEVGVVGADNNSVLCESSMPTISSVDCDWHGIGYHAAALLHRLMNGGDPPEEDQVIPPQAVASRASTELWRVADTRLSLAMTYVRDHPGELFGVERLLDLCGISRRTLELIFRQHLGCSPHQFLNRARVEHAKRLFREHGRPTVEQISQQCGFRDVRRFREVFRRVEGVTPMAYQRQCRPTACGTPEEARTNVHLRSCA